VIAYLQKLGQFEKVESDDSNKFRKPRAILPGIPDKLRISSKKDKEAEKK